MPITMDDSDRLRGARPEHVRGHPWFEAAFVGRSKSGRVSFESDSSGGWHMSYGGGVFFQMLTLNTVFHGAVAHGDEGTRFYVDYGFAF
jgi:hypothetical protein